MAAGGPNDHPLSDILTYNLNVYNIQCDNLIKQLSKFYSNDFLFELIDWPFDDNLSYSELDKLEKRLLNLLITAKSNAENNDWKKSRTARYTSIEEYKTIEPALTIVRESHINLPKSQSNIYCIKGDTELIWHAELPNKNDCYPNPIQWFKGINTNALNYSEQLFDDSSLLTVASMNGITVSINIRNGKIIKSEFTK